MDFIIGSRDVFLNFLNSIDSKDKVAILTHNDLDGIACAVFLEEILKNKNMSVDFLRFNSYNNGFLSESFKELKKRNISKVFATDMALDVVNLEDFQKLRKDIPTLLIDHHPHNKNLKDKENIIKTDSQDCASLTVYKMGQDLFDSDKFQWLVFSSVISDMAIKKEENLNFIKSKYPDVTLENIFSSEPGKVSKYISYSLIYLKNDVEKIYNFIKNKNISELEKYYEIVNEEIKKYVIDFKKNSEYYPERGLYFYYFDSDFSLCSILSNIISNMYRDKTFIFATTDNKDKNFIQISARNQNQTEDMNILMQYATNGLEDASGGGHVPASGGRVLKKDFEEFKKRIINGIN